MRRSVNRLAALAGALAAVTGALVTMQVVGASPAGAVPGLQKINGTTSASDSQPTKTVHADCPAGQRVLGGGGWIFIGGADADKVGLTELRPVHPASGVDQYVVTAEEVTPNITSNWSVQAFAICAAPVSGMSIVPNTGSAFNETDAFCPVGQVVLGSGGKVNNPAGHVKLITATPFQAGDRVRTAAASDTSGATNVWTVTSYAVCAPRPAGYQVVFQPSALRASEPEKLAAVVCPAGTRVHGAAAVTVLSGDGRGISLQLIYPFNALDRVQAFGVETQPNSSNWEVRAVAICAA
jgi:hypothetical protein